MEATATTVTIGDLDSPVDVLAAVRERRTVADRAEADQLLLAVEWARMHSTDSIHAAATLWDRAEGVAGREDAVPVAGVGAPLVAEFCVAEFAAAVGLPTEHGRVLLGEALELAYRLPRVSRRVQALELPAWRARRIARRTIALTREAAAHVDRHLAPVAHRVGPAQTERLVAEAVAQFMPETAEEVRRKAADGRHFTVDHEQVSFAGTSAVYGELDLADALDLDAAIAGIAAQLKDLGCEESLDVRRSLAAGELARRQPALDLAPSESSAAVGGRVASASERIETRGRKPREVVLYVHLHRSAVDGIGSGGDCPVGRVENTGNRPVTAEQIRTWCGNADARVTVKPVIDLAEHVHVGQYEVPERIAEHIGLRDQTCVFPYCTRPARNLDPDGHGCDCDHVVPYARGGPTCSCQLAPLCRRHHRAKTHTAWTYTVLEPGSYLWSSPHGLRFLRDHQGTTDLTDDRPSFGGSGARAPRPSEPET